MYYKFVSDVDGLSVEWEYIDGYRHWQSFSTETELSAAIAENEAYNLLHKEEVEGILKEQDEQWLHMLMLDLEKDPTDTMCLSDYELNRVKEYRKNLIEKFSA